ncbi:MAG: LLM class flavin-dependent oxidoreductase, partial [Acidimicrobiia bacterium]|nr:LLM class flavin-dependent oxidoreductase [Acidimicrobiia bacterium]
SNGLWEAAVISGALAESTSTIRFGPSVLNAPYRPPGLVATMAETLSEVSGGRFVLGVGAGNTTDYDDFGIAADPRYSRFAEWLTILHGLLRDGSVQAEGEYYSAPNAELILRGPTEIPLVIAGAGPKMLRLAARYATAWNWWTWGQGPADAIDTLAPTIAELDRACEEVGRDPATLGRTMDVYSVVAPGMTSEADEAVIGGSADQIADALAQFGTIGVDEVRCDVFPRSVAAIEAMSEVADLLHGV